MYNDILTIGPITIHGYGLMIGIGILCAMYAGMKLAKKKGLSPDEVYNLTIICVISGIASAKLLYCLIEWKEFIRHPLATLGSDGFVVYGGIIGGTLIAGLYTRLRKLSFWDYFDLVLPSVAITQGFGRIGCFLAGCCYGRRTTAWFGITFRNSGYAPNGIPLYPTQLMSSAGCFIMAGILFYYAQKDRERGKTGGLYLIMYSIGRSVIEMFRGDHRGSVGFLSTSQFISIFILITGLVIFFTPKTGHFGSLIHKTENNG